MITLTLLAIVAIVIIFVTLFIGVGALIVIGDIMVALIVLRVIFRLVFKRKEEGDLD